MSKNKPGAGVALFKTGGCDSTPHLADEGKRLLARALSERRLEDALRRAVFAIIAAGRGTRTRAKPLPGNALRGFCISKTGGLHRVSLTIRAVGAQIISVASNIAALPSLILLLGELCGREVSARYARSAPRCTS